MEELRLAEAEHQMLLALHAQEEAEKAQQRATQALEVERLARREASRVESEILRLKTEQADDLEEIQIQKELMTLEAEHRTLLAMEAEQKALQLINEEQNVRQAALDAQQMVEISKKQLESQERRAKQVIDLAMREKNALDERRNSLLYHKEEMIAMMKQLEMREKALSEREKEIEKTTPKTVEKKKKVFKIVHAPSPATTQDKRQGRATKSLSPPSLPQSCAEVVQLSPSSKAFFGRNSKPGAVSFAESWAAVDAVPSALASTSRPSPVSTSITSGTSQQKVRKIIRFKRNKTSVPAAEKRRSNPLSLGNPIGGCKLSPQMEDKFRVAARKLKQQYAARSYITVKIFFSLDFSWEDETVAIPRMVVDAQGRESERIDEIPVTQLCPLLAVSTQRQVGGDARLVAITGSEPVEVPKVRSILTKSHSCQWEDYVTLKLRGERDDTMYGLAVHNADKPKEIISSSSSSSS